MASLVILTADELIALDIEGRGKARRAARETPTATRVLRTFLARGGPIPVEQLLADAERGSTDALSRLDEEDLIRIRDGHIDLAYPFSVPPTAFVVRLPDGRERYVCCAIDALGVAPMIGQRAEVRSRCHHTHTLLQFALTPKGPEPEAAGVMLWVGQRTEERCRGIDSL
jgi:hypothetical protein